MAIWYKLGPGEFTLYPPEERASCHPQRRRIRAGDGDLCRTCFQLQGILRLGLAKLPPHIDGVRQLGGEVIPAQCPKCLARPPSWVIEDASAHCIMCGRDFFKLEPRTVPKGVTARLGRSSILNPR
jgi:hypothetical protein